ncbi:3-oxoacyl-[acyl-carrier-protein] synthase-3 [Ruminiclostridium sufflavum DSM 19573]|uniref:3-oxoacyl-[acyl-carrier-protein] synthase-3 n=1 Tax=Ruminiclostridium sufflavum DSM 19573 TaxID=1121337 RepID=A0A318XKL6_9FIRM|nr:ketoacyl-ACP synthase III [Ruminiclostridium sufflavum]PYG85634.1 3-oxoacyl-[acyl-carrier-protein] synthase-3 [Ruminiclostridium sufflavum DSM 19573]
MNNSLISAGILGVAAFVPEKVRKNDYWKNIKFTDLKEGKNPFDNIEERRVFPEEMLPSDAEAEAGRRAMETAGVSADEIDLVMVQSMSQDEILPGNACIVQYKLGLKNAGAWTVDTCCSSFVTMVVTASNLIAAGEFKKILIITSAFCSHMIDYSDYQCCYLGDAAGAAVLGPVTDGRGYMASYCNSHGEYHKGFTLQLRQPKAYDRRHFMSSLEKPLLTFDKDMTREIGKGSVEHMRFVLDKLLEKTKMNAKDIDLFLSHQPCHWAHAAWRDSVGILPDNSYQSFSKYGNIASATIPVNLSEAAERGMLKDGSKLLLASSGAGENHIAAILRWGK